MSFSRLSQLARASRSRVCMSHGTIASRNSISLTHADRFLQSFQLSSAQLQTRTLATAASSTPSYIPDVCPPYAKLVKNLAEVRRVLGATQGLTLAEKIIYSHLDNPEEALGGRGGNVRGEANLKLKVDRVAMQDASAQMALLQFMTCGLPSTAVPASIHCDHMIVGENGADVDLPKSIEGNKEVFDFLESAAKKYGIQFWAPGSGIIHQI